MRISYWSSDVCSSDLQRRGISNVGVVLRGSQGRGIATVGIVLRGGQGRSITAVRIAFCGSQRCGIACIQLALVDGIAVGSAIGHVVDGGAAGTGQRQVALGRAIVGDRVGCTATTGDRKSTRLNSSH